MMKNVYSIGKMEENEVTNLIDSDKASADTTNSPSSENSTTIKIYDEKPSSVVTNESNLLGDQEIECPSNINFSIDSIVKTAEQVISPSESTLGDTTEKNESHYDNELATDHQVKQNLELEDKNIVSNEHLDDSSKDTVERTTENKEFIPKCKDILVDNNKASCSYTEIKNKESSNYHLKWFEWKGEQTPIVTQNENGPCPLLAIANVLILARKINLPKMQQLISGKQLMEYIGNVFNVLHFKIKPFYKFS